MGLITRTSSPSSDCPSLPASLQSLNLGHNRCTLTSQEEKGYFFLVSFFFLIDFDALPLLYWNKIAESPSVPYLLQTPKQFLS